jgi:hypothetical protein
VQDVDNVFDRLQRWRRHVGDVFLRAEREYATRSTSSMPIPHC